jgi:hypothetical protein
LFKNDLKLFVYPLKQSDEGPMLTVDSMEVAPHLRKLYEYLRDRGSFVHLDNFKPEYLSIFSREILRLIKEGNSSWEPMVPLAVAELIKRRGLFGHPKINAE